MTYRPEFWNAPPRINLCACFSYALNIPGLGHANLGGVQEIIPAWRNEQTIRDRDFIREKAAQDGLLPVQEREFFPDKEHIIAIFTGANWDSAIDNYHYDCHHMRLDADGSVSDKPGKKPIRRIVIPAHVKKSERLNEVYASGNQRSWFMGFYKFPEAGINAYLRHDNI